MNLVESINKYLFKKLFNCVFISSSSSQLTAQISSTHTLSLSLSLSIPIVHFSRQVFQATSSVRTELMLVRPYWPSSTGTYMCRDS